MNGRRSFDPSNPKPFNINIFYNINSRNITNNHNLEVQSHPVSARVNRNNQQLANNTKNQLKGNPNPNTGIKPKTSSANNNKTRKKKYSVDLSHGNGIPTQKKLGKITKKSNSNSISSGFPSQTQYKRQYDRAEIQRKNQNLSLNHSHNENYKNQKKLGQLLQIFTQGKIDKNNLTKQIINIFEFSNNNISSNKVANENNKQKKMHKKKRSQSTLICTSTPKNSQMYRFGGCTGTQSIKAVIGGLHKNRKRHSKSQKGSFTNSKTQILKQQLAQKIILCKNIDSSLFLQPDDEKILPTVDRTNDVLTSYSIVLLNQNLKKQRKLCSGGNSNSSSNNKNKQNIHNQQNMMAIRIQRAWRKYRTKLLIKQILQPRGYVHRRHQHQHLNIPKNNLGGQEDQPLKTDENSQIKKLQTNSLKNSSQLSLQNYLSQQLQSKKFVKQNEIARAEQLKDYEIKKWNQIISFVHSNISEKKQSSDQCLRHIIQYFQNAKKSVQKELMLQKFDLNNSKKSKSKEFTQFTNQVFSRDLFQDHKHKQKNKQKQQSKGIEIPHLEEQQQNQMQQERQAKQYGQGEVQGLQKQQQEELQLQQQEQQNQYEQEQQQQFNNGMDEDLNNAVLHRENSSLSNSKLNQSNYNELSSLKKQRILLNYPQGQLLKSFGKQTSIAYNPDNLSFQVVQNTLVKYTKKIELKYQQKLHKLDKFCQNYLQSKKLLEEKYKAEKKEIKRILKNLNQGYLQAKTILEKEVLMSQQDSIIKNIYNNNNNGLKSSNSKQSLQKCKSDNYLLKTAINYKKYIQKKQKNEYKQKQKEKQHKQISVSSYSQEEEPSPTIKYQLENAQKNKLASYEDISKKPAETAKHKQTHKAKILNRTKYEQNLQINSMQSISSNELILNKNIETIIQEQQCIGKQEQYSYSYQQSHSNELQNQYYSELQLEENKSNIFNNINFESGQGYILNNSQKYTKLQQKIISEQLLQYEQIHKQFDQYEEKEQILINSNKQVIAKEISLFQNNKINQINKKFKNLTSDDKDDIFEFLFIDLTMEIIIQYDHETKLYQTIRKFIERKKLLDAIPKGVKTSLQASKDYLTVITNTVLGRFSEVFCNHIVSPMGPTARQMLRYMHDQSNQQNNSQQEASVPLILPIKIFQNIQASLAPQYPRNYEDETKQLSRRKFLKSVDHIHHKAIFDCLNQALDGQRPYGIWGLPFPWKTSSKITKRFDWSVNKKKQKLNNGIQKVVECCSYMCGILVDKQDSIFQNSNVSKKYVQQIRQDRMSKALANQLAQGEDRWHFYDDEQTEVMIQVARVITVILVEQFIGQFQGKQRQIKQNSNKTLA